MLAETRAGATLVVGPNQSSMKVSILIPTCRRPAMLGDAIHSARAQTYSNVEIVISDDGGDAESQRIIAEQVAVDPRVRLAPKNPTPGLFENFNHLLGQSTGDVFIFLCDDDRLLPHCVERLVGALERHPEAVAAVGEFWFCDAAGRRLEHESRVHIERALRVGVQEGIWPGALHQALIAKLNVGCALFRAKELGYPRFDLKAKTVGDVELWIRTALAGPVYYTPERLTELRQHPQSISAGPLVPILDGMVYTLTKHAGRAPAFERDRLMVLQIFRASYAWQLAVDDAPRVRRIFLDYLRDAGTVPHLPSVPSLLAALVLSSLPRPAARPLRKALQRFKEITQR